MDANHINAVIESFMSVMPQLGLTDVKREDVSLKGRYIQSPGVVIILGIVGDIKGNIIYGIGSEDAKKIASCMMMGMPVEEFNELAQSAISELTNMLTATVATNFSKQGINVNISTPTLVYGEFTANASTEKVICVGISANGMRIDANISLEKSL